MLVVGGVLVGVLAGGMVAAVARSSGHETGAAPNNRPQTANELGHTALHGFPLREVLLKPALPNVSPTDVPPVTYVAALKAASGDLNKTEELLISKGIPPLEVDRLVDIAQKSHYNPTPDQQLKAEATVNVWSQHWKQGSPLHLPPKPATKIFESLTPAQEKNFRQSIVDFFYSQKKLGVHEAYKNKTGPDKGEGCNCGPHIDDYTAGHNEKWCADFVSYTLNAIGFPLNGGKQFGRPDWQLPRVYDKPGSSQRVSMRSWFEDNAYWFTPGQRLPEPGDVAFMINAGENGQLGDEDDGSHVMFVLGRSGGQLLLGGGNTADAVSVRPLSIHSAKLVGFGSLFPAEQSPSPIISPKVPAKPKLIDKPRIPKLPKLKAHLVYPAQEIHSS